MNGLVAYYHCYMDGADVWKEQVEAIKMSGLDERWQLRTTVVSKRTMLECADSLLTLDGSFHKVQETGMEERETLRWLHHDVLREPWVTHVLYFHTKGATSQQKYPTVVDWRRLMDYFLLWQWRTTLDKLDPRSRSVAGVNWGEEPWPHFSGNYWMATAEHIRSLRPPPKNGSRLTAERWVGQNSPNVVYLHQSGVNHYTTPYPKERYR